MDTYREQARELPVARDVDVIVAGAGPAGTAAAVGAARCGAHAVLIERFGYPGGTATASLMACINGFRNQVEPDDTQTVRGIAEEVILALKAMGGLGRSPYPQKNYPTEPGRPMKGRLTTRESTTHLWPGLGAFRPREERTGSRCMPTAGT